MAKWVASLRNLDGVDAVLKERQTKKAEEKLMLEKAMPIPVADGVAMRVVAGDGPLLHTKARVSYVGKYSETMKIFDKSSSFVVESIGSGQVIPCWDLALPTMHVGDRVKLQCRKDQAYGEQDLEFDIVVLAGDDDVREENEADL